MSVRWLSFQSFQNSQELISAINTLLIHLKLKELGVTDKEREEKANEAQEKILLFLESFEKIVSDVESEEAKATLGTDVRFRQLAKSFIKATNNRRRFKSLLFQNRITEFKKSLAQGSEDNKIQIESLEDLRLLVEEHLSNDIEEVLGEG